jgi:hypothetical protein
MATFQQNWGETSPFLFDNNLLLLSLLGMEILTTSTSNQSFKIIPRVDAGSPTFSLYDKSKRKTSTVSVTSSISGGYMTLTGSFSLEEGNQYGFTVKDGSTIIYRGIIFCTDQTNLDRYTVNSGEYTHETSHDNEFVVI